MFTLPKTKAVQAAADVARLASEPWLYNHCVRTFHFAQMLARREIRYDEELLCVAALLHDLGLTPAYDAGGIFYTDGADAASRLMADQGWDERRRDILWQAIAFHGALAIAARREPEVALIAVAAAADVVGLGIEQLDAGRVRELMQEMPRLDFRDQIFKVMRDQVKNKPRAYAFTWMTEIGWRHVPGFSCPTFHDLLMQAPFES